MIDIEPSDLPLRLIYVKNGAHLVARIPVVPGYQALRGGFLGQRRQAVGGRGVRQGHGEHRDGSGGASRDPGGTHSPPRSPRGSWTKRGQLLEEIKGFQTKEDLEMMLASRQAALVLARQAAAAAHRPVARRARAAC